MGLKDESLKQVYYAQCRACSGRQAQLMRNGTRVTAVPGLWPPELVVHSPTRLATQPSMTAMLVGMRYYVDAAVRQGPGSCGGRYGGNGEGEGARFGHDGAATAGSVRTRRGGWRWLWEQRPRQGKELWQSGEGEVLLVLSGGEADDDEDADDDCDCDQHRRGFPELFAFSTEFVMQLR